MDMQENEDDA